MHALDEPINAVRKLLNAGHVESAEKVIPALLATELQKAILQRHAVPTGTQIVHYTSISVLKSILDRLLANDNVSLRAYDSVHLNDPSEGQYLLDFVPKEVDWLDDVNAGTYSAQHTYVASFIMDENGGVNDDLIFWRGYGNEGEGCSLSFTGEVERSNMWKVLYGDGEAQSTMDTIVRATDQLKSLSLTVNEEWYERFRKRLVEAVWWVINQVRYLYKSSVYEYENECRFVPSMDNSDLDVRFEYNEQGGDGSPRIRHYIEPAELDVRSRLLVTGSEIILGPTLPQSANAQYCFDQLTTKARLATRVKISEVPYRKT